MTHEIDLTTEEKEWFQEREANEAKFWDELGMPEGLRKLAFDDYNNFLNSQEFKLTGGSMAYKSPMARKMFMVGYLYSWLRYRSEATFK